MKVEKCVSVKNLFENFGLYLSYDNRIEVTQDETTENFFYDLKNNKGETVCMDGESCEFIYDPENIRYYFINRNGETETHFYLSIEEFLVAIFE